MVVRKDKRSGGTSLPARFGRSQSGATMVEFAIIGPIFILLIGAILETSMAFFAGHALDSAVQSTARLVRTGQAQTITAEAYRNEICTRGYGLFDCENLKVSVRPLEGFASYAATSPIDPQTGDWTIETRYETGQGDALMLVEAYYKWPVIVTIPGLIAGATPDGRRLLAAARLFRNEAF
ncbi:TadE/TadG family type IV pilus assembly protein [Pelagibacterium montanilacus]|uniref:TadE/TadG family type IV pilus assembly protein n=1 Tax=Pelagibacterium montanilacus TaxID=2185280 RepID=UPI000F8DDBAE|nr:TadE/TadG family type IV pilus assembly protein [Pelagibacterium montanilacus]